MEIGNFTKYAAITVIFLFVIFLPFALHGQASDSANVNLNVTTESTCNNNGICETDRGENSANCPNDCVGGGPVNHTECNLQQQCIFVTGSGTNQCNTSDDCSLCDPHGDINKDGHINIVDFSILMYFWHQTSPSNPCADLNKDGIVDLTDFSIMLYWWTG